MSAELGSLLVRAAEELSPIDGLDDARLSRVVRTVRRRRVRRHAVESATGVAVASVVGTAVWAGLRLAPAPQPATPPVTSEPTVSPTPSATPTPTPTPSPTPTSAPTYLPVPATFGQPASEPVTDAILSSATEGWSLVVDQPTYYVGSTGAGVSGTPALYLLSPTADRYRLVDLPNGPTVRVSQLQHWKAGDRRALVEVYVGTTGDDGEFQFTGTAPRWIDLLTGQMTDVVSPGQASRWVGIDSTGSTVWQDKDGFYVVAPDGTTRMFLVWFDGRPRWDPTRSWYGSANLLQNWATAKQMIVSQPAGGSCMVVTWLDASSPVVSCSDGTGASVLRRTTTVVAAEGADTILPADALFADPDLASARDLSLLPDGRLVGIAGVDGVWGVYIMTTSGQTTLLHDLSEQDEGEGGFSSLTVAGDVVYVIDAVGLTAHDVSTGRSVELASIPTESGAPYGLGEILWVSGTQSWIPGTSY
ncbi:hypothetical protein [Cellulomonas sp. Root137]|uniref:hypothetical protein n=1 Tax=Cellulomonas sp. Root137 TaxID=1736459 RepID=UPI0006FD4063|nr:hypothetical protein [Cellulomonas sp. Root137]KQY46373.1 hypothetical protein ASD18_02680 [Cellulomonas sp. Root137]